MRLLSMLSASRAYNQINLVEYWRNLQISDLNTLTVKLVTEATRRGFRGCKLQDFCQR